MATIYLPRQGLSIYHYYDDGDHIYIRSDIDIFVNARETVDIPEFVQDKNEFIITFSIISQDSESYPHDEHRVKNIKLIEPTGLPDNDASDGTADVKKAFLKKVIENDLVHYKSNEYRVKVLVLRNGVLKGQTENVITKNAEIELD